jgi:O-acetyl-ADP-ribose deacetylase (regulator of RNase III)
MIEQKLTNLVEEQVDAFIHQANCFNTMRSGVAKSVVTKYPEVYEADCKTTKGDRGKMGTFSFAKTSDGKIGYNLYSQFNFGYDGLLYTNYDALRAGLLKIKNHIKENISPTATVGIPCKMGCTRGGGDWNIVLEIIKDVFETDTITVVICEFKEYSTSNDQFVKSLREAYKKTDIMGNECYDNE